MKQLFYFTGGGSAKDHYSDTILGSVDLPRFANLLTEDQRRSIEEAHSNQPITGGQCQDLAILPIMKR
jgi:hypothetical protein